MNISVVLADTGRQTPAGLSLLNVGWKASWAIPQPDDTFTLPEQSVAVLVDAEFGEIRTYPTTLRLVQEDGEQAHFRTANGLILAEIRQQLMIMQPPGSPPGGDGTGTYFMQFPQGSLCIRHAPSFYKWEFFVGDHAVGDYIGEAKFWVNALPAEPQFGGPVPGPNPGLGT